MIFLRSITVSILALAGLLWSSSPAFAHKLSIDWRFDHGRLHIEAFYDDDTPAQSARIAIESGKQIVTEGQTDEKGVWSCPLPSPGSYTVRAESVGHAVKKTLTVTPNASTNEEKASQSPADKASATPSEATELTEEHASRSETTETPWLKIGIGFAVIAGLCSLWRLMKRA